MVELLERYPSLEICKNDIMSAADLLVDTYKKGGKLLLCGNGGSCADCDHISGELLKGFLKKRSIPQDVRASMIKACPDLKGETLDFLQCGLPAISLPSLTALMSAYANDCDPNLIYAQGVLAMGKPGDVLIAISTSGNSKNVIYASQVARATGVKVVALTGGDGGELKNYSDICIAVPEKETFKVQELHLPVYHFICKYIEESFFEK